jgi:hypothetical protein
MNGYIMSVGADGEPAPDKWITDWGWDTIADSHIAHWWDAMSSDMPHVGDIVIQASIITGKLLGIFRKTGLGEPHPFNPERWAYGMALEPLVLWDGRYAPTMVSAKLGQVPRRYRQIQGDEVTALMALINHHLPALYVELTTPKAA